MQYLFIDNDTQGSRKKVLLLMAGPLRGGGGGGGVKGRAIKEKRTFGNLLSNVPTFHPTAI